MSLKGETAKEYLREFPEVPSLTLARMVYAENRKVFKDVEDARSKIRYQRGSLGEWSRKSLANKSFTTFKGKYNPFDALPEGLTCFKEGEPYQVEGENILVIADLHIPYHVKEPLKVALERGREKQIDTLIILGDFGDFYSQSFWQKDPRKRDFNEELQTMLEILDIIRQQFPDAKIIWDLGNHEERYDRYMKVKAPELLNVKDYGFKSIMKTDYYELDVVEDKRVIKVGKHLNLIHGHEFGKAISTTVNPARGLFLKGKETGACAHHHRSSAHTAKSMTGDIVTCWSIGCLCDLRPDYLPINEWNHGFAEIERDGDKFWFYNKRVIEGKIYST